MQITSVNSVSSFNNSNNKTAKATLTPNQKNNSSHHFAPTMPYRGVLQVTVMDHDGNIVCQTRSK
jgi:hypothetical protein